MNVSVTIATAEDQYVQVEAEHDTDAFSTEVLDDLLSRCASRAHALTVAQAEDRRT